MKNFLKNRMPALLFGIIAGWFYGQTLKLDDKLAHEKTIAKSRLESMRRQYHTLDSLYKSGVPYSKVESQASSGSDIIDSLSKNQKSYPY